MSEAVALALRTLAASLPPDAVVPVPAGELLAILNANGNGAGAPAYSPPAPEPDRLLTAAETAHRLGVSVRYLYQHRADFPFTKHLPGGAVRFSERGLLRWLGRA